jgi:hypothetical protein
MRESAGEDNRNVARLAAFIASSNGVTRVPNPIATRSIGDLAVS